MKKKDKAQADTQTQNLVLEISKAANDLHEAGDGRKSLTGRRSILEKRAKEAAEKGFYCTLPLEIHRQLRNEKNARQDAGEKITMSDIVVEVLTDHFNNPAHQKY